MKLKIERVDKKEIEELHSIIDCLKIYKDERYWNGYINEDTRICIDGSRIRVLVKERSGWPVIAEFYMKTLTLEAIAEMIEIILKQKLNSEDIKVKIKKKVNEVSYADVELSDLIKEYQEDNSKTIYAIIDDAGVSIRLDYNGLNITNIKEERLLTQLSINQLSVESIEKQINYILKNKSKYINSIEPTKMVITNMEELQKIPEGGIGKTGSIDWGIAGYMVVDDGYEFTRDDELEYMINILGKSMPKKWEKEYGKDMKKGQVFKRAKIGDRFYWETRDKFYNNEKMKLKKFYISAVAKEDLKNASENDFINNLEVTLEIK